MFAGRHRFVASLCLVFAIPVGAQQYSATMLSGLQWRDVGPMRGGRTYAVAGNAAQPDTFYMGSVGGGVWKTENSGRTWFPIADDPLTGIPIGSIGAIAVAPSDPNIIYVGTGEPDIRSQHSYGIGLFKSTDAGKTWHSIGLAETRQIGKIVVDPADPNRVYVAALGHVYEPNPERGVYRSLDGGAHWKKILVNAKDPDNVGAVDLALDPQIPQNHLRIALGDTASAVGSVCTVEYAWRRTLQIHRWRRHVASAWQADFPRTILWARSASQLRPAIQTGCTRLSMIWALRSLRPFEAAPAARRGRHRSLPAESIYLMMPERRGGW